MSNEEMLQHRFRTCSEESFGEDAEQAWQHVFRKNGVGYIPLSKIDVGRAPMLEDEEKLILPDFEVSTNRLRAYVDSKGKRGPVLYRKAGEWRHGINRRNWEHYLAIAARHIQKSCLGILELFTDAETKDRWSGSFLIQTLQTLGDPIGGFSNQSHMVYFPRRSFVEVCRVPTALELVDCINSWRCAPECREPLIGVLGCEVEIQSQLF